MSLSVLPISVNICTLNEEKNIGRTIEAVLRNTPAEILVIDGDSKDQTESIVRKFKGIKFENIGRKGLAFQRQYGVEHSTKDYIAVVDADDILEPDCLARLYQEARDNNYQAIQAKLKSYQPWTYWEKGMDKNVGRLKSGPTAMVGRPALYSRMALVETGYDPFFTYGNEDTDISIRFEEKGYMQGIGSGICYRKHAGTFLECWEKWKGYGVGDARIIYKYPRKAYSLLYHIIIRYPFLIPYNLKGLNKIRYWPFFFLCGIRRSQSCIFEMIKLLGRKK